MPTIFNNRERRRRRDSIFPFYLVEADDLLLSSIFIKSEIFPLEIADRIALLRLEFTKSLFLPATHGHLATAAGLGASANLPGLTP